MGSSSLRVCTGCPRSIRTLYSPPRVGCSPMHPTAWTSTVGQLVTSTASSRARKRPTCRCRPPQSTNWSLTSRPLGPSASTCRQRCSPAPKRASNEAQRVHHAEAFSGRPLFTHALGHVGKHIELGHEHQPTFAPFPSALLKAGADRHCPPSSLPW